MGNMTNYYNAVPENLDEVLSKAFEKFRNHPDTSDVTEAISDFKNTLWQNDFIISPRPKVTLSEKDLWFFGVHATPLEKILYPQLAEIDYRILERNPIELLKEIGIPGEIEMTDKAVYYQTKGSLAIYAFKVNF